MDIQIITDGTIEKTKLTVDGKDVTKNNKVVYLSMYASSPFKGSVSGDVYKGNVNLSYEIMNDNGTVERKSVGSSETAYINGIGQKIKTEDSVIQYIGQDSPTEIATLVDKIVTFCDENKVKCVDRTTLLGRTKESLEDKILDLGIK